MRTKRKRGRTWKLREIKDEKKNRATGKRTKRKGGRKWKLRTS